MLTLDTCVLILQKISLGEYKNVTQITNSLKMSSKDLKAVIKFLENEQFLIIKNNPKWEYFSITEKGQKAVNFFSNKNK